MSAKETEAVAKAGLLVGEAERVKFVASVYGQCGDEAKQTAGQLLLSVGEHALTHAVFKLATVLRRAVLLAFLHSTQAIIFYCLSVFQHE